MLHSTELCSKRNRNRVLKLGFAVFNNPELPLFGTEGLHESLELRDELGRDGVDGEAQGRRVSVVGRLRLVDVIVRIDDVVAALLVTEQFKCQVRNDLVASSC